MGKPRTKSRPGRRTGSDRRDAPGIATATPAAASRSSTDRTTIVWLAAFAVLFAFFLLRNFVLDRPEPIDFQIGGIRANTFGLLVTLAIVFGFHLVKAECLANGEDWQETLAILGPTILVGLVFAHVWEAVLYHPGNLWERLLNFRIGLSSFGGVISAVVVYIALLRARGLPLLQRTDWLAYGFTGAWLFGRLACFSIHDHPGVETSFFLGVFTRGAVRHDLGLYELLLTIPSFALLTVLIRRAHPRGMITAIVGLTYLPARFALDTLRVHDATYGGLTPAQWLCLPGLAFFGWFAYRAWSGRKPEGSAA
jgi:phosphatidylglycerol:prolipoprotein diacylglycerol transferase